MHESDITFFFEGRRLNAHAGDSIASALFKAGVRTLSYSVKYRRPRGVHCARGRCVMCHMEVDRVPGVPTCITPVVDGMHVRRENFRPFFAPLLVAAARLLPFPAGFYYRMFTRPAFVRRLFLGSLRRMAGVGQLDPQAAGRAPTPRSGHRASSPSYDVVVVGGGLSGMSAALSAARHDVSVLLVDEYAAGGGHSIGFNWEREKTSVRDDLIAKVLATPTIEYLPATTALAFYSPDTILLGPGGSAGTGASNGAGLQRVRSASFVFGTGAYDTIPLFLNNDTPGILGLRAIRLLLERDGLRPGSRAVAYGTGSELTELTRFLAHHKIDVVAVVDGASVASAADEDLPGGTRVFTDSTVVSAHGRKWLSSVSVGHRGDSSRQTRVDCDLLCVGFPGQGAYELAYQSGFRFEMAGGPLVETRVMRPTETSLRNEAGVSFFVVGELAGQTAWTDKVRAGEEAGKLAVAPRQALQ